MIKVYKLDLNGAFKKIDKPKEESILQDIQNCDIVAINSKENFIEIVYKKDEELKYLTINKKFQMGSMGQYCGFSIDDKKLENSEKSLFLQDMKKIVKIFHMCMDEVEYHNEFIEILFKDNKNTICSYRINIDVDEDFNSVDFLFTRYENIFKFKSEILNDEKRTEFNFSYDDECFYPSIKRDSTYNDGTFYRANYGDYPDYSCITYGKKVFFEIDRDFIKAYNLGFLHNEVIERKYFDMLSINEKDEFKRFLSIAELYINDLGINQKFDNEIIFDWEKEPEHCKKLDILNKNLENSDFKKELVYYDGKQGHPSGKEVYIYTKDDKKLFYFWEIGYYGDYERVTIKYNDDFKDELLCINFQ